MHYEKKIQMFYKKRKDTDASVMLFVQLNISALILKYYICHYF